MKITKYIHSLIEVQEGKNRILIDPGPFSFIKEEVRAEQFEGIKAIFITHKHADHYDPVAIKRILENNRKCLVFGSQATVDELQKHGIGADVFEDGIKEVAGFRIKAFFAEHEPLPDAVPPNTAFLFNNTFLHPGDSFDPVILENRVRVIALPVLAPWLTSVRALDFILKYKPKQVIPVHDGYAKDFFLEKQYLNWEKWLSKEGIKFTPCAFPGDMCKV